MGRCNGMIWRSIRPLRKVQAHKFWSWQMAVSPDEALVASVTGQYLAGGYKYEPAAEQEPSIRVYDAQTGELKAQLSPCAACAVRRFQPGQSLFGRGKHDGRNSRL